MSEFDELVEAVAAAHGAALEDLETVIQDRCASSYEVDQSYEEFDAVWKRVGDAVRALTPSSGDTGDSR